MCGAYRKYRQHPKVTAMEAAKQGLSLLSQIRRKITLLRNTDERYERDAEYKELVAQKNNLLTRA